ncbi:hypothetical protein [Chryseobacterium taichungense]|uniref:hypothetical protein n=1 Tax=Chryseobacterium taichungense TaxID=295069 RepID=UPI0028A79E8C|nr:hypothetical protein [Chryseobacterium taichungense]
MQKNISSILNDDLFTGIYTREFINKRSLDDAALYNSLENTFFDAFSLVKENKIEESFSQFEDGEKMFPMENSDETFKLILKDTLYPKKAYLYYKTGNIKLAAYLTLKSIVTNQKIKEQTKVDLPVFVQIQQYQNISRICFRTNHFSEGIVLNCKLLLFLITKKNVGIRYLSEFTFDDKTEESALKCTMIYQIVFDTVKILYKLQNKRYLRSFIDFISNILPQFVPAYDDEMILKEFLELISKPCSEAQSEEMHHFIGNNQDVLFPGTIPILTLIKKIYENEKVVSEITDYQS